MTLKKRASKSITLALVGIIVSTPIFNTVSAMENNAGTANVIMDNYNMSSDERNLIEEDRENMSAIQDMNDPQTISERFSDEQVKLLKVEFQEKNGTVDEFKQHKEDDGSITEINGCRGIIRTTDPKTGEILETNLFEIYDTLNAESSNIDSTQYNDNDTGTVSISRRSANASVPIPRGGHSTQSPADRANLKATVSGSTVKLVANNPIKGTTSSKSYKKTTSNWYTGSTKAYYNSIRSARRSWGTSMSHFNNAWQTFAIACASNVIQKQKWNTPVTEIAKLAKYSGLTASGGYTFEGIRFLSAYIANMGVVYSSYLGI